MKHQSETDLDFLHIKIPKALKVVGQKIAERQGVTLTEFTINGLKAEIQQSQEWLDLLDKAAIVAKAS